MTDIPWPTKFVPLFDGVKLGTSPDDVAYLTFDPYSGYAYRQGFRDAATHLIQAARSESMLRDTLVLPALFNFRHFIELALKEIIADARIVLDVAGDPPKKTHKIEDLWRVALGYLRQIDNVPVVAEDVVERHINEFAKVDPHATAFRYARDLSGAPSLPDKLIDLAAIAHVMESVGTFLDCSLSVAGHAREYVLERRRESS